mmetsp:Transcript_6540/g.15281  ORF Transcript_6540/g.15281 Transcript_6540/m.15281 type:complete len:241 (+) Transcript_6540:204-926(+)
MCLHRVAHLPRAPRLAAGAHEPPRALRGGARHGRADRARSARGDADRAHGHGQRRRGHDARHGWRTAADARQAHPPAPAPACPRWHHARGPRLRRGQRLGVGLRARRARLAARGQRAHHRRQERPGPRRHLFERVRGQRRRPLHGGRPHLEREHPPPRPALVLRAQSPSAPRAAKLGRSRRLAGRVHHLHLAPRAAGGRAAGRRGRDAQVRVAPPHRGPPRQRHSRRARGRGPLARRVRA